MTTLALVGLLSGLVTAISPCVLPVLPVVLTTSIAREPSRWRPFVVVGGLVVSFGTFTLLGGALLSLLNLPADLLRWLGIATLAVVGLGLLWPRWGHVLEAPFLRTRIPRLNRDGSGFVLGLGMGLVFVPCAGPILASITVLAATTRVGWELVVLTLAYCVGIAIPLLGFALAGSRILERIKAVRERTRLMRGIAGGVMIATALAIATNAVEPLQRLTPDWLDAVSDRIESDGTVRAELDRLAGTDDEPAAPAGTRTFDECAADPSTLADCGEAPELTGLTGWLNSEPLTLTDLQGKVVLLDFWTYSCINCQRTLPHLTGWADEYADDGLVVIGVHSPEFAFESVERNVAENADRLGVRYPIALDNDFATWRAYDQRFWPAHYLIDRSGVVRQVHYGEGAYTETEAAIRTLLEVDGDGTAHAGPVEQGATLTSGRSPETYLGADRMGAIDNSDVRLGTSATFDLSPTPPLDAFSLGGTWDVRGEYARAVDAAMLTYRFYAAQVHLVVGGEGTVTVSRAGAPGDRAVIEVSGPPTLYTVYDGAAVDDVLRLELSEGLEAYAFTFG
jgi:cytochrome c biogenesis protein CcdA/thiol-disulfide isomerase/thioredoxin